MDCFTYSIDCTQEYFTLLSVQDIIQNKDNQDEDHIVPNLEKNNIIKYENVNIGHKVESTVKIGYLNNDLYYNGYTKFNDNCKYVVIYIPIYKCEFSDVFTNPTFQIFTSEYMNSSKHLEDPLNSENNLDLLEFDESLSLEHIVVKTYEYIMFNIKKKSDFLQLNKEDTIYLQNSINYLQKLLIKCENINTFSYNMVARLAIEIDITNLIIKNINLENIENKNKMESIKHDLCNILIPEIDEYKTYRLNYNIYTSLLEECIDNIEFVKNYIIDLVNDDCIEILELLENNKFLIEYKMLELVKEKANSKSRTVSEDEYGDDEYEEEDET